VCVEFYTHLPAYEDGTDRALQDWHIKFRRWGITQKHTTFRTQRKFKIKNY